MSEFEEIKRLSNSQPNACSCSTCKEMCTKAPCLGTPSDIKRLIDHGFKSALKPTLWGVAYMMNPKNPMIPMIQAARLENGNCTFLNPDGLCELHDLDLKPTEGRLASHEPAVVQSFLQSPNALVARSWIDDKNVDLVEAIFNSFL